MEINLPDDVERLRPEVVYERGPGGFVQVAKLQPDPEGEYIYVGNVSVIQSDARREERETLLPLLDELRDAAIAYAEGAAGAGERLSQAEAKIAATLVGAGNIPEPVEKRY